MPRAFLPAFGFLLTTSLLAAAEDRAWELTYPASQQPGELVYPAYYKLWLPGGLERVRGVIVHQHGCGGPAAVAGRTAADDLHWQALARKWDCALLGPSYGMKDGENCRLWSDPANGSEAAFLRALRDLAKQTGHPELESAPWCLWGHSGGGSWVTAMTLRHPERIVGLWCRSGGSFGARMEGAPAPEIPAAVLAIPTICNPGVKEKDHERFNRAYSGMLSLFKECRAQGGLVAFAPDPRTSHECGDSRYLAIPFFDACLAQRLPEKGVTTAQLRTMDPALAWLGAPQLDSVTPARKYTGNPQEACWLPGEAVAQAWLEYVKTGAVSDTTRPFPPANVKAVPREGGIELTWTCEADFESGLQAFIIKRDGEEVAQFPEMPLGRFGRPLFQRMSYHDTPEAPLPEMRWIDTAAERNAKHKYRIIAVNSAGLKSKGSKVVRVR